MAASSASAGRGSSAKLTVRISEELATDLDMYAAARGVSRSDAARELLREAVFAKREREFAPLCRSAVREELNKWLDSARMQKEYAADDFYDRLSAAVDSELAEMRQLLGAGLYAAVAAAAHTDGDVEGDWDAWYAEALRLSWTMGLASTLGECESYAASMEGVR